MDYKAVRELLRRRRLAMHLTLDDVADSAGLDRATIHSIENLKREPDLKPKLETLESLASALKLTLTLSVARTEDHGADPSLRGGEPVFADLRREIYDDLAHTLLEAATREPGRQTATTRPRTAGGSKRG